MIDIFDSTAMTPSMPGAVPGGGPPPPQTGTVIAPPAPISPPTPGLPPAMPPGMAGGQLPPYPVPPMPMDPSSMQYETETQSDGTVLLRIKNQDGTLGPVVQIVKVPTPGKSSGK